MIALNTDTTNMKYLEWDIAPFNIPYIEVEPPAPFYNYCSFSHISFINNETHKDLLEESLNIYDEIWTTLAKM